MCYVKLLMLLHMYIPSILKKKLNRQTPQAMTIPIQVRYSQGVKTEMYIPGYFKICMLK